MRTYSISLVIPAYNVKKYIEQCLESVTRQTVKPDRVILVDDGSFDGTEDICRAYAQKFSEYFVYHRKENAGLGAARNTGLEFADTDYVAFLDSDDFLEPRYFEKIQKLLSEIYVPPDMVFTLPVCYDSIAKRVVPWMDAERYEKIFDKKNRLYLNGEKTPEIYGLEVNANRKIYRRSFLEENHFSFPEGVKWEDIRPHVQLVHRASGIVGMGESGFVYRMNRGEQITMQKGSARLDILKVFDDLLREIKSAKDYTDDELAYIMEMIFSYSMWMIEMTDAENIGALLDGLHEIFLRLPEGMEEAFSKKNEMDKAEKNKRIGLLGCLKSGDYHGLSDYVERRNLYRCWSENAGKKKNLVRGGIQCIKENGFSYTVKLVVKKIGYLGLKK